MFEHIDGKKNLLDNKHPFPKYTARSLREKLFLEWTYHSNAIDGNGRTSRLLLNLELMKASYPPIIIKVENRLA